MIECRYKTKIKDVQDKYKFKIFCYDATGTSISDFNANAAEKTQEFNDNAAEKTQEFNDNTNWIFNVLPKVTGEGETITLNDTSEAPMILNLKGNTSQASEPTPTSPVPVSVVSGDNTIEICGKNLLNNSVERKNAFTTGDVGQQVGYGSSSVTYSYVNCAYLQANTTYTISWNKNTPANTNVRDSVIVDENNIILEKPQIWTNNRETYTFTPTHNGYLIFAYDINTTNIQLEKGSTSSEYEAYTGQSQLISLGGNNFKKEELNLNKYLNQSGSLADSSASNTTNYMHVIEGVEYILNYSYTGLVSVSPRSICFYNKASVDGYISSLTYTPAQQPITITPPTNANYVRITLDKNVSDVSFSLKNVTPIELCKIGTYQDYIYKSSGKWYLHKEIGKVVLDGTQSGSIRSDVVNPNTICYRTDAGITNILSSSKPISNYFTAINDTSDVEHIRYIGASGYRFQIFLLKTTATTADEVQTWLSTHNTILYYVLATPTNTEITDTTLLSQLEELKSAYSYQGTTNISQTNDDLGFIISATAIYDLNNLVPSSSLSSAATLNMNRLTSTTLQETPLEVENTIEETSEE